MAVDEWEISYTTIHLNNCGTSYFHFSQKPSPISKLMQLKKTIQSLSFSFTLTSKLCKSMFSTTCSNRCLTVRDTLRNEWSLTFEKLVNWNVYFYLWINIVTLIGCSSGHSFKFKYKSETYGNTAQPAPVSYRFFCGCRSKYKRSSFSRTVHAGNIFYTTSSCIPRTLYLNKTNRFWLHQVTELGSLYGINGTQNGLLSREYEIFHYF